MDVDAPENRGVTFIQDPRSAFFQTHQQSHIRALDLLVDGPCILLKRLQELPGQLETKLEALDHAIVDKIALLRVFRHTRAQPGERPRKLGRYGPALIHRFESPRAGFSQRDRHSSPDGARADPS
jgi:hypothetical protein